MKTSELSFGLSKTNGKSKLVVSHEQSGISVEGEGYSLSNLRDKLVKEIEHKVNRARIEASMLASTMVFPNWPVPGIDLSKINWEWSGSGADATPVIRSFYQDQSSPISVSDNGNMLYKNNTID